MSRSVSQHDCRAPTGGIAFLNGEWVSESSVLIDPRDAGFVYGAAVAERLRTYAGQPRFAAQHVTRFLDGMQELGIQAPAAESLVTIVQETAQRNLPRIEPSSDLLITLFSTPGQSRGMTSRGMTTTDSACKTVDTKPGSTRSTLAVMAEPLSFSRWAPAYERGQPLRQVSIREVDASNWPRHFKSRSRLHYWLAEREAEACEPGSKPLLLNRDGTVAESTTALVAACFESEGVVAPPLHQVLPSISFHRAQSILNELDIAVVRREIQPDELHQADEILLFSSPYFCLPVNRLDGRRVGTGRPGPTWQLLVRHFSAEVNVDLIDQARLVATTMETRIESEPP